MYGRGAFDLFSRRGRERQESDAYIHTYIDRYISQHHHETCRVRYNGTTALRSARVCPFRGTSWLCSLIAPHRTSFRGTPRAAWLAPCAYSLLALGNRVEGVKRFLPSHFFCCLFFRLTLLHLTQTMNHHHHHHSPFTIIISLTCPFVCFSINISGGCAAIAAGAGTIPSINARQLKVRRPVHTKSILHKISLPVCFSYPFLVWPAKFFLFYLSSFLPR